MNSLIWSSVDVNEQCIKTDREQVINVDKTKLSSILV